MPDKALARIDDPVVREALLELRSEFYRELRAVSVSVVQVATSSASTSASIDKHAAVCESERAEAKQFRESIDRVLHEFKEFVTVHMKSDESYQERMDRKFSGAQIWLIGTLVSLLLAVGGAGLSGHLSLH